MALDDATLLVDDFEAGRHRLVVGDALWIVAFHQPDELVGERDAFLLDHFVVADDIEDDVRRDKGDAADFIIVEELVGDFDHPFAAALATREVVGNRDGSFHLVQLEERGDLEEFGRRDMVDDGAVLDSGHLQFFIILEC